MATMATQGPWLKIASVSQPKSVAKSTELGFLTSQLSGVRISHGYYSDVINRIAVLPLPLSKPSSLDESALLLERKQTEITKCLSLTTRPRSCNSSTCKYKKVWWEAGKRFVKLRLSTKALKTIEKNGLDAVSKKAGIDLRKK